MATEREIDDLAAIIGSAGDALSRIQARDALAAGYRKFEVVDEPPSPADGGPAFGELKQVGDRAIKQGGLTIRDYFAGKALQGMFANSALFDKFANSSHAANSGLNGTIATAVYQVADAMLKERAK